jgi:hypothetical protein
MNRSWSSLVAVVVVVCLGVGVAWAGWARDGVPLATSFTYQTRVAATDDDAAVVAFTHEGRVRAQKLDGWGNVLWPDGGVPVSDQIYAQASPNVVSDGAGGVIVVWGHNWQIWAQRVDAGGARCWGDDGVAVCGLLFGDRNYPALVGDGQGGAVVVWFDRRDGSWDIHAQRVDASGSMLWTAGGLPVCTAAGGQDQHWLAPDGSGGAVFVWRDARAGNLDIYAQRVRGDGQIAWPADGLGVCTEPHDQHDPWIASDGEGSVYLAWQDQRGSAADVFVQRISLAGEPAWATDGVMVCGASTVERLPRLVAGPSGAIVVWEDRRADAGDLYAQRVGTDGSLLWTAGGVPVCVAPEAQNDPFLAADGTGGIVVAWQDGRGSCRAQHLDAGGVATWADTGVRLGSPAADHGHVRITGDGAGGAVVVFSDETPGGWAGAQRVDRQGHWGYPCPEIASASDVPGDQGGLVNLAWHASRLDPWPLGEISVYSLWRALPAARVAMLSPQTPVTVTEVGLPGIRHQVLGDREFFWEYLHSVTAYQLPAYASAVPTLLDSTAVHSGRHDFQVIAHGQDQDDWWASPPDSGYSVDNLAPPMPLNLTGEQVYGSVALALAWDACPEADVGHYAVHRGESPDFVPGPDNLIGTPVASAYVDEDWPHGGSFCYAVAAVDVHGNVSGFARLTPEMVTAVAGPTPLPTCLEPNVPNPFNPATCIRFSLPAAGPVRLVVFDERGRRVRVLVHGERQPGRHRVIWDGRDDRGRDVPAGVYLCRLVAADATSCRKLALVR